ncbi:HEAT repeat domain-containing protein [Streptomyces sp. NPDC002867]
MSGEVDSELFLISAVRAGDADAVESLLLAGTDPDVRDGRGTPALCLAIELYAGTAAHLLAEHGADPEQCGPDGVPPLRKADAAAALRAHPDPVHRLFGAEVLRLTHLFDTSDEESFAGPALELFADRSGRERDAAVLTEVLVGLSEHVDPRADAALLPYADHPDVRVRRAVASGFSTWPTAFSPAVQDALLDLMTDPDAEVRQRACRTVADGEDRDPALADAMATLLDDVIRQVRVAAVYALARHDDERCVEGARRLPPPPPGTPHEYDLDEVWRYRLRRDGR